MRGDRPTEASAGFAGEEVPPQKRAVRATFLLRVPLPGDSALIGGDTAEAYDTRAAGNRDSVVVLPLILLAIGVVLAVLLRSPVAPLYLMATILFTYFATLGLAVVVFVVFLDHPGAGRRSRFSFSCS